MDQSFRRLYDTRKKDDFVLHARAGERGLVQLGLVTDAPSSAPASVGSTVDDVARSVVASFRDRYAQKETAACSTDFRGLVATLVVEIQDSLRALKSRDAVTNLALAVTHESSLFYYLVGDSFLLLLRGRGTGDPEMVHLGTTEVWNGRESIGRERASSFRRVTLEDRKYIGGELKPVYPMAGDIPVLELRPGDWVLVATDGLTRHLEPARILELYGGSESCCAFVASLQGDLPQELMDDVSVAVLDPEVPSVDRALQTIDGRGEQVLEKIDAQKLDLEQRTGAAKEDALAAIKAQRSTELEQIGKRTTDAHGKFDQQAKAMENRADELRDQLETEAKQRDSEAERRLKSTLRDEEGQFRAIGQSAKTELESFRTERDELLSNLRKTEERLSRLVERLSTVTDKDSEEMNELAGTIRSLDETGRKDDGPSGPQEDDADGTANGDEEAEEGFLRRRWPVLLVFAAVAVLLILTAVTVLQNPPTLHERRPAPARLPASMPSVELWSAVALGDELKGLGELLGGTPTELTLGEVTLYALRLTPEALTSITANWETDPRLYEYDEADEDRCETPRIPDYDGQLLFLTLDSAQTPTDWQAAYLNDCWASLQGTAIAAWNLPATVALSPRPPAVGSCGPSEPESESSVFQWVRGIPALFRLVRVDEDKLSENPTESGGS